MPKPILESMQVYPDRYGEGLPDCWEGPVISRCAECRRELEEDEEDYCSICKEALNG